MKEFKYTTSFSSVIKALIPEDKDKYLAMASLVDIGDFIPEVDHEKNIDLLPVAFNAFVANRVNKNGDDFDIFVRRTVKQTICGDYFIFAQLPTENMFNAMRVGVAHSFYFYKNFFLNPGYSVDLGGFDNGDFNVGITYKF